MAAWHIWGEQAQARMEELSDQLFRFPDSPFASARKDELDYLTYLKDHGVCPGGYERWKEENRT